MSQSPKKVLPATITLLDKGCEFNGKLTFEGIVRIDGVFQGEIFSQDRLIIGDGAVVEANVHVGELEVGGRFKGNIFCDRKTTIHGTGKIQGSIQTRELEVHLGAVLDGAVEMSSLRETAEDPAAALKETVVRFSKQSS